MASTASLRIADIRTMMDDAGMISVVAPAEVLRWTRVYCVTV
jgi:hypothetical protein